MQDNLMEHKVAPNWEAEAKKNLAMKIAQNVSLCRDHSDFL